MAYNKKEQAGNRIIHGRRGRIRLVSEMNTDREVPSRQVWVELWHNGSIVATSSGNLVESLRRVDLDRSVPLAVTGDLTDDEMEFVDSVMEQFEGRKD